MRSPLIDFSLQTLSTRVILTLITCVFGLSNVYADQISQQVFVSVYDSNNVAVSSISANTQFYVIASSISSLPIYINTTGSCSVQNLGDIGSGSGVYFAVLSGTSIGSCNLFASVKGDIYHDSAITSLTLPVIGLSQTITFGTAPTIVAGGIGTVSATGGASGNPVIFSSNTPNICTTSGQNGNGVAGITPGACIIAANQAGTTSYYAAPQVTQSFSITASQNQTISFGSAPFIFVGNIGTVSATSTSGLPVSYSSLTPSICTVFGSSVTGITPGSCTIAADQSGNFNYNAAVQVTQSITINKLGQAIDVISFSPSTLTLGGITTVTGISSSGLAVTFSSATPGICTVSGNTVTSIAAGTCTIAADQAGNTIYSAAMQVTQNICLLNLVPGWNLVGNSSAQLFVSNAFGNPSNVSTVWKWENTGNNANITYPAWAFYTPTLADGGQAYAASKGYDFLTTINGGEGFWVNAIAAFSASMPSEGLEVFSAYFKYGANPFFPLPSGWSLISVGDNPTPRIFANAIALTQTVSPAVAATSLTTLWAWDSSSTNWYFYAPSLDNAGTLTNYITSKGYLDFTAKGKTLDPTTGFWVNHP